MFGLARISSPLPRHQSRELIAGGKLGTAQTIKRMRDLVSQGKRDFRLRTAVARVIDKCPAKDYSCYAQACFEFCRDEIKYVFDPNGVEMIEAPYRVLESRIADCDSVVVLLAAMLESLGFPCEYVTVAADVSAPDQWSHVYLRCEVPKRGWVGMDATMDQGYGWEPDSSLPRKYWPASNDVPERHGGDRMAGLGQVNTADPVNVVPHLENTVGVKVGSEWDFRLESASVTARPEELELDAVGNQVPGNVPTNMPEFFTAMQADDVVDARANPQQIGPDGMPVGRVAVVNEPVLPQMNWKVWALLGVGAYLLWRSR